MKSLIGNLSQLLADATLIGFPLNRTLIITMKAVNEAGKSLPSTGVSVALP